MKTLVVVALLTAAATARADETPAPPDVDDGEALTKWVATQAKAAKAGQAAIVRMPLMHHGEWGANFPTYYIGASSMSGSCPCIDPTWAPGAEEESTLEKDGRDTGAEYVVEGRFTGTTKKERGETRDDVHTLYGFHVLRWRKLRSDDDSETKLRVVLDAKQAAEKVAVLADDKPWLVVVDSFALFDKGSDKKAAALLARVQAAGQAGAEVLDSRQAPLLFCCYRVVVAARAASRDAALAIAKELKKKKLAAGVRRGW
jgi:hypothetical protein